MVKNKFLRIIILIFIGLFVWFCSYNIKQIQSGRDVKIEEVLNNSYRSSDNNLYLEFINENLLFYKYINEKEENSIQAVTSNYIFDDGLLVVDSYDKEIENFNIVFLSDDRLYFVELHYILYLDK